MKSIIRLPGLIAFFVMLGLMAATSIIFMDYWIKLVAEKSLANTTGAEVNIASVEHSFSPFGITLNNIQLTDPKAPLTNQFEAESVAANIDLAPLLLRKLIIDDLTISGVQLGSLRDSKGDVYREPSEELSQVANIFADAKEMLSVDKPVIFDCVVDKEENCYPMIPSGKPHNQMLLGPQDEKEEVSEEGKTLV